MPGRRLLDECGCGSFWLEALAQRPWQGRQDFIDDGVAIDAVSDHVGIDEGEVGDRRRYAVCGEFDSHPPAELLDGGLAHRVGEGSHAVEEREHRTDEHELAAVGEHLVHGCLDRVHHTGDVDREHGLDRRCRCGAQRGGGGKDSGVGDGDVDPSEVIDDVGDGTVECAAIPYVGDRSNGGVR